MILVLYRDKLYPTPKPFPPVTRFHIICDGETQSATVEHLPLITSDGFIPPADPPLLLRFDNGTATEQKYEYLSKDIHPSATAYSLSPNDNIVLPTLFHVVSKSTMDSNGAFRKGYISRQADNNY